MKQDKETPFPTEAERRLFGREVLARAARMVAEGRSIPLKGDVAFKLFLAGGTEESDACLRLFLSAVTGRKVRKAAVRNPELLPDIVGRKRPRLDVNCEFDGGQLADVELQLTRADDDQKVRALYYGAKLLAGTLAEGASYGAVPCVYQIFLIDFDLFGEEGTAGGRSFFHRALMRLDDGTVFSDRLQLRFFDLKVPGRVDESLQNAANWCRFIAGGHRAEVREGLSKAAGWREEFAAAMDSYGNVTDEERAWAYHLSMDRAEADYRNGLRLAREEGELHGFERGTLSGKLEDARNMLARNYPVADIAEITGLSAGDIEALSAPHT